MRRVHGCMRVLAFHLLLYLRVVTNRQMCMSEAVFT